MNKIFLTGITGLVGSAFVTALVKERDDYEFVCLVRKTAVKSAEARVDEIIREQCEFDGCPEIAEKVLSKISVVEGDVVDLNVDEIMKNPKLAGINIMFHCAADVNLGKDPTGKVFRINYDGTVNVLNLAKRLKVREIHYVGTAYVAGKLRGRAMEDNPIDSGFNNPYEESKYKAEMLVRASGIPFSIYRPSIINGRLSDGRIRKPLAFYRLLEFLAKMKSHRCSKLKISPETTVDMQLHFKTIPSEHVYFVPIDYVQRTITALFQKPVCNKAYHVTGNSPMTTLEIDDAISDVLNLEGLAVDGGETPENMDEKLMERFVGDLYPYFSSDIIFDQTNVIEALGPQAVAWTYGSPGLQRMIRSFYRDFFGNVEWLQAVVDRSEAKNR